jgi:hypothetical protein
MWRRLDTPGLEHCRLTLEGTGPRLEGTVLLAEDGMPLRADYELDGSAEWETRVVLVTLRHGSTMRQLRLTVDGSRRWYRDGEELTGIRGCIDVDLSLTPSTNTLPICRLGLSVGEASDVTAAWIRFPELRVEPLSQRYTRRTERLYGYESAGGTFASELEVDELGLIVAYPPLWQRVAGARSG